MTFTILSRAGVKSEIIDLLSRDYPKSAKQIHSKVSKKRHILYTSVHKALKELEKDHILQENNKMYELNPNWVENLQKFIDNIDVNYKLSYKIFSRFTNSMMLDFLDKKERVELSREIEEVISHKATMKLNEWYSKYYDHKNKEFDEILKIVDIKDKHILELGCGTGRITKQLSNHTSKLVAVDRNRECIDYCCENISGVMIINKDIRDLKKSDFEHKFDVVISSWIGLHYFSKKEIEIFLELMTEILSKGGKLIILEAYYNTDYVNILDELTKTKNNIKEHIEILKEKLVSTFGSLDERIVMTDYKFPSFELLEETFKIELEYEERVHWRSRMTSKLKNYLEKNNLKNTISEAPVIFVCGNK